ncbi:hypothetical protein BHE90_004956 [Fusarium euwallaceae]|uniref:Uncharacterized protein n=3 Tax=Fusarium solani species complex TaxID=232080 RepID=A0A428U3P8_9HYPO|nr:hypothetical protein CEP51_015564 [Fusarium floridanum]RSM08949.1 hypothetical protein CEP52_004327 [Fusarium oligoseptatum]RTE80522.1 hypothetical protein BHE90_004956 [Fusarium euwallaceae]
MRFNPSTLVLAVLASTVIAGHSHIEARVPQVNDPLSFLSGLSYAPITDLLNQVLGPPLRKIEDALNFTLTQKLTESLQGGAPLSVLVAVVEAVGELLNGAEIGAVDRNLAVNSNGYFDSLDSALGVVNIGEVVKGI